MDVVWRFCRGLLFSEDRRAEHCVHNNNGPKKKSNDGFVFFNSVCASFITISKATGRVLSDLSWSLYTCCSSNIKMSKCFLCDKFRSACGYIVRGGQAMMAAERQSEILILKSETPFIRLAVRVQQLRSKEMCGWASTSTAHTPSQTKDSRLSPVSFRVQPNRPSHFQFRGQTVTPYLLLPSALDQ